MSALDDIFGPAPEHGWVNLPDIADWPVEPYDPKLDGDDSIHAESTPAPLFVGIRLEPRTDEKPPRIIDAYGFEIPQARIVAGPLSAVEAKQRHVVVHRYREFGFRDHGSDCRAVKRCLARLKPKRSKRAYLPVKVWSERAFTPLFGPFAVRALKRFQREHGITDTGRYGEKTHAAFLKLNAFDAYGGYLMNLAKPPQATREETVRLRLKATMLYVVSVNYRIGYTQSYPTRADWITRRLKRPSYPANTDCSMMVTFCWADATDYGGPNPNGYAGWPSYGYTGTMRSHGRITFSPKVGDDVHYGPGTGRHVGLYLGSGMQGSHGSTAGPRVDRVFYRSDFSHFRDHVPDAWTRAPAAIPSPA